MKAEKFTILGGKGFIGAYLVRYLNGLGYECFVPARNDPAIYTRELGHVIYCIGLTADFRQKPFETVEAHVCHLAPILKNSHFSSFLYLSSTRVYTGLTEAKEEVNLSVNPQNPSDLYNLSKLMGEALCFATHRPLVRVARLANVYGADFSSANFLTAMLTTAVRHGSITLETTLDSSKDYISIDDVVRLLTQIALHGTAALYNVASGKNVTNQALTEVLTQLTDCQVSVLPNAIKVSYPTVCIDKIKQEFAFEPQDILSALARLLNQYKVNSTKSSA